MLEIFPGLFGDAIEGLQKQVVRPRKNYGRFARLRVLLGGFRGLGLFGLAGLERPSLEVSVGGLEIGQAEGSGLEVFDPEGGAFKRDRLEPDLFGLFLGGGGRRRNVGLGRRQRSRVVIW